MRSTTKYQIFFTLLLFFSQNLILCPSRAQERPQEEVTVIAVEVPVRAFHKGQVVKNLAKEDFEIYQNGIKQEITDFEVISRKIAIPWEVTKEAEKFQPRKRLFFLIFNIFDYNEEVGKAIDYFFENVFRPGDQIIILTEDKLLNVEIGKSLSGMIIDLKETLKKYKNISTMEIQKAYHRLRLEGDRLLSILQSGGASLYKWDQAILRFYENYLRTWKEFKRRYISPDLERYRIIVKRVKQLEGEKWALCFQQRELFPKLKREGPLSREIRRWTQGNSLIIRQIQVKQQELQRSLDYSTTFPTEFMKNLFMEANITFHLILLRPFKDILSEDFELREVAQDYEDCFRQISTSTGGYSTFSNKVTEALKEAVEIEDFHYLLVYQPKGNTKAEERKITVKVKKSGVKVIHFKRFSKKEAPPIFISDFKAGHKSITFSLSDYKMAKIKGKLTGIADVKITIFDENSNKVFDEGKTMNLFKKESHISLNFNWLKSGDYFIIIQAMDKISNEGDVFSRRIEF
jgi:hypothetical protein